MLDDDDGVAKVCQAAQDVEQLLDIVEVQAGGGLIQDVEGAASLAAAELARQLNALRFAA